jgi:hypothetical protein
VRKILHNPASAFFTWSGNTACRGIILIAEDNDLGDSSFSFSTKRAMPKLVINRQELVQEFAEMDMT